MAYFPAYSLLIPYLLQPDAPGEHPYFQYLLLRGSIPTSNTFCPGEHLYFQYLLQSHIISKKYNLDDLHYEIVTK